MAKYTCENGGNGNCSVTLLCVRLAAPCGRFSALAFRWLELNSAPLSSGETERHSSKSHNGGDTVWQTDQCSV